jgi:hypothetical protein
MIIHLLEPSTNFIPIIFEYVIGFFGYIDIQVLLLIKLFTRIRGVILPESNEIALQYDKMELLYE